MLVYPIKPSKMTICYFTKLSLSMRRALPGTVQSLTVIVAGIPSGVPALYRLLEQRRKVGIVEVGAILCSVVLARRAAINLIRIHIPVGIGVVSKPLRPLTIFWISDLRLAS